MHKNRVVNHNYKGVVKRDILTTHHRGCDMEDPIRISNPIATCAAIITMVIMTLIIARSCVDGVCDEVDRQRQHEPAPSYTRPAAYRMQTPTPEQMESYHGIMTVMEVNR